jgi:hypothetical protein
VGQEYTRGKSFWDFLNNDVTPLEVDLTRRLFLEGWLKEFVDADELEVTGPRFVEALGEKVLVITQKLAEQEEDPETGLIGAPGGIGTFQVGEGDNAVDSVGLDITEIYLDPESYSYLGTADARCEVKNVDVVTMGPEGFQFDYDLISEIVRKGGENLSKQTSRQAMYEKTEFSDSGPGMETNGMREFPGSLAVP